MDLKGLPEWRGVSLFVSVAFPVVANSLDQKVKEKKNNTKKPSGRSQWKWIQDISSVSPWLAELSACWDGRLLPSSFQESVRTGLCIFFFCTVIGTWSSTSPHCLTFSLAESKKEGFSGIFLLLCHGGSGKAPRKAALPWLFKISFFHCKAAKNGGPNTTVIPELEM